MAIFHTVVGTTLIRPSQTLTTHDTNTCVKVTIVSILSISERLAIANLFYSKKTAKKVLDLLQHARLGRGHLVDGTSDVIDVLNT